MAWARNVDVSAPPMRCAHLKVLAYEPLRVSLSDLLSAETKGKWWLVGAGWSGNPLVDRRTEDNGPSVKAGRGKKQKEVKEDEEVLWDLARKQGMNTDVRRSVFVVLMTSEVGSLFTGIKSHLTLVRTTCTLAIVWPNSN